MRSDACHHILVALLGRTPQVLTETLYALCVYQRIPISEVWAISTAEGMKAAIDKLFDPERGCFYQMQKDYPAQCGHVRFSAEQILVSYDGLLPLADIRNRQDSETFLELILRVLWEKSRDPNVTLQCSLVDGRNTVFYAKATRLAKLNNYATSTYNSRQCF